ncbi:hypothetical protein FEM08_30760 [Flavobacterium gilvum]|nr:hypothetical protein FEM08_30760 [Flavobacterium gilvum]
MPLFFQSSKHLFTKTKLYCENSKKIMGFAQLLSAFCFPPTTTYCPLPYFH